MNLLFTRGLFIDSAWVKNEQSSFCQYGVPMTTQILCRALGVSLLIALVLPLRAADSNTNDTEKAESKVFEEPPPVVTTHSVTLGGKTLKYHTTAGYIVLKEEEGKPLVKAPDQKPAQEEKKESEPEKTKDGLK